MNRQMMDFKEAERDSGRNEQRKRTDCDGFCLFKPFGRCLLAARLTCGVKLPCIPLSKAQTSPWPWVVSMQI